MSESMEVFIGVVIGLGIVSAWVSGWFLFITKAGNTWPVLALAAKAAVVVGLGFGLVLIAAGLGTMAVWAGVS